MKKRPDFRVLADELMRRHVQQPRSGWADTQRSIAFELECLFDDGVKHGRFVSNEGGET